MRISLAISLILAVVTEMIAGSNGLGFFIMLSERSFQIKEMYAGLLGIAVIGYALNHLYVFLVYGHLNELVSRIYTRDLEAGRRSVLWLILRCRQSRPCSMRRPFFFRLNHRIDIYRFLYLVQRLENLTRPKVARTHSQPVSQFGPTWCVVLCGCNNSHFAFLRLVFVEPSWSYNSN